MTNLERCMQLHEEIEIIYVVDGYLAGLITENRPDEKFLESKGHTIQEALKNLDTLLTGVSLSDVRKGQKPKGLN